MMTISLILPISGLLPALPVLLLGRTPAREPEIGDIFRLISIFLLVALGFFYSQSGLSISPLLVIILSTVVSFVFASSAGNGPLPWSIFSCFLIALLLVLLSHGRGSVTVNRAYQLVLVQSVGYTVILVLAIAYFFLRTSWRWKDLGLTMNRVDSSGILIGVVSGLGAWIVANLIYYSLIVAGFKAPQDPLTEMLEGIESKGELFAIAVMVVAAAPLVEEFLFRSIVFGIVRRKSGLLSAVFVSAVSFTLLHGVALMYPGIFVVAVVLALLYDRYGTIVVSFAAHAAFNSASFALFLITGPDFFRH